MSKVRTIELTCPQCGEKILYDIYDSVNVQLDPELKGDVISGNIFLVKCDHCGYEECVEHELLYHDMEKKTMINYNRDYAELIYEHEKYNKDKTQIYSFINKYYKHIGVASHDDLITAITCVDNNLDYRVVYVFKTLLDRFIAKSLKDLKNVEFKDSYLTTGVDSEDKKCIFFVFITLVDGEIESKTIIFDEEKYKLMMEKCSQKLDLINPYVMNKDLADTIIDDNFSNLEIDEYYCVLDENLNCYLCKACEIIKDDIKEGDRVLFLCNDNILFGIIKKTLKVSGIIYESCPNEKYGKIVDLIHDVSLSNAYEDKKLVNNKDVIQLLQKQKNKLDAADFYKALQNNYFYVQKLNNESLTESIVHLSNGEEIKCINIYSSEEIIQKTFSFIKYEIYSFNDILKYAKNKYKGILIDDEIILDRDFLCDYISYCSMLDFNDMKDYLSSLTDKERKTIDDVSYEYIRKIYFENKNIGQLAKEYKKEEDEIQEYLDKGYRSLMEIAFVRF